MLKVQEYILKYGLQKLQEEFFIQVNDYEDRVVLNYNQIDSQRFHPICDECRALILKKSDWSVLARSFDRFYNLGESIDSGLPIGTQRFASQDEVKYEYFDISKAKILQKLDGTLISIYWDGMKWCYSTRKMAFAEGETMFGRPFYAIIESFSGFKKIKEFLDSDIKNQNFTFVFELTGPENRVVTPYTATLMSLIGVRHKDGDELSFKELESIASKMNIGVPESYSVESYESLLSFVKQFPAMEEGVVLVLEQPNGSHRRIKCKNPSFVAIAHMRENGGISPKNVLNLIMTNEQPEYLKYFPEDQKYFDYIEKVYDSVILEVEQLSTSYMHLTDQKDFALAIQAEVKNSISLGALFAMRKGSSAKQYFEKLGAKRITEKLNLKEIFQKEFFQ